MTTKNEIITAYNYQKDGLYDKALECFINIGNDPEYRERAKLEIAKIYKMMNNPLQAIKSFIDLIEVNPHNNEAIKELGEISCLSNIYEQTIKVLNDICGRNPAAYLELGNIYCQLGDFDKALKCLGSYSETSNDDPEANIIYAKIYKKLGRLEEALKYLVKVTALDKNNYEAICETGDLFYLKEDYNKAIEYYLKASKIKDDKEVHLRLAELYQILNKYECSKDEENKILNLTPKNCFDQDMALNKIEILRKDIVLRSKVKRLWATLTTRCNIKCKTCGLWNKKWDLPYKTAKEIMDYYPFLERVVWLGGEVFLYKHFEEMFDKAASFENLTQHVITNGVILTDKWINKIVQTKNTELAVSIDGVTKDVYESIRQGSSYDKLMKNVKKLIESKNKYNPKMNIRLNAVIMKSNYLQIEDFIEFAKDNGFNQVSLMALHFNLAPDEDIFYENKDADAIKFVSKAIPAIKKKSAEYKIELDILLPPAETSFKKINKKEDTEIKVQQIKSKEIVCKMPWQYMMICDNGDVLITGSCLRKIGNIDENSLDEIWNSKTAVSYRRNIIDRKFEGICRTECMARW
ncbi:MAG: radical SAM protein [Elusimicrobia bacterium]|nr:radical SAM protein [Candidatus Liberimonas magnetica]